MVEAKKNLNYRRNAQKQLSGNETILPKAKYSFLSKEKESFFFPFEIIIIRTTELFGGWVCKSKKWLYLIKNDKNYF